MINKIYLEISKIESEARKQVETKIENMIKIAGVKEIKLGKENVYDDNNYYDSLRFYSINEHSLISNDAYSWEELHNERIKSIIVKIKSEEEAIKLINSDDDTVSSDKYSDYESFELQVAAICYEGEINYSYLIDLMTCLSNVSITYLEGYMND